MDVVCFFLSSLTVQLRNSCCSSEDLIESLSSRTEALADTGPVTYVIKLWSS